MLYLEAAPPGMSLREESGQYIREEVTQEQQDRRLVLLREILTCIDELCEVTAVLGPANITESHRILQEALDAATLDAVYLALERDAVLLSEDGGLRLAVADVGLTSTAWVQPLLMFARERGALEHPQYVDVLMGKVARNHDFISVRTEDVLALANREPGKVAAGVLTAFDTFRSPTLDLSSGVMVCAEFLSKIIAVCPPVITADYVKAALEVLQQDRPENADTVHRALAAAMEHGMESLPKKQIGTLRRQMKALLKTPVLESQRITRTPVSRAVRELIFQMERLGLQTK
jgi:hypothetical protein